MRRVATLWKSTSGGMALEAALVFPIVAAFLFAVTSFVLVAVSDMALQTAVSETVKQVAAHAYPVELAVRGAAESGRGQAALEWAERIREWQSRLGQTAEWFEVYARFLPEPFVQAMTEALRAPERWQDALEEQLQRALSEAFRPLLLLYADRNVLLGREGELRVTRVRLPSWNDPEEAYFGLEAEFRLPLPIPFFRKEIVLKHRAMERIWTGR